MQIGQKIIRLDTVDSTNNYTANLIKDGKVLHGTVILADEQTAGRGQRGTIWSSKAGENILLSLYVTPDNLSVNQQVALTHFASVSAVKVLRKIGISAKIKWPNDIFVNDQKIGGILIENTILGSRIAHSIIGIGLNVNQIDFHDFNGTSLRKEINEFQSIENIVFMLIYEFNDWWNSLSSNDLRNLRETYLKFLYLLNEEATFEDESGIFRGTIKGVSDEGLLLIDRLGEVKKYDLKEIRFISKNDF